MAVRSLISESRKAELRKEALRKEQHRALKEKFSHIKNRSSITGKDAIAWIKEKMADELELE